LPPISPGCHRSPFLERFDARAKSGIYVSRIPVSYDHPLEAVGDRLKKNGMTQALFNCRRAIWDAVKRIAALPARFGRYEAKP